MHITLKATKYRPAIKYVILGAAAEEWLIVKYGYMLLLLCMRVYNVNQWRIQEFCWGGSTNSVEDRGQRDWGSGGSSPLVRGSGGSCK